MHLQPCVVLETGVNQSCLKKQNTRSFLKQSMNKNIWNIGSRNNLLVPFISAPAESGTLSLFQPFFKAYLDHFLDKKRFGSNWHWYSNFKISNIYFPLWKCLTFWRQTQLDTSMSIPFLSVCLSMSFLFPSTQVKVCFDTLICKLN